MLRGPSQGLLRALWNLRKSSFTALVSRCAINPCVCTPAGYCDESCSIYNISPLPPPATPDHAYTILSVRVKLETKNQDEMYLVLTVQFHTLSDFLTNDPFNTMLCPIEVSQVENLKLKHFVLLFNFMLVWDIKYSLLPSLVLHLLSFMFSNTLLSLLLLSPGMLTSTFRKRISCCCHIKRY